MIVLSLALGVIIPLLPGIASHQEDIANALPFLKSSIPDFKTAPFVSTRSGTLIAGQCALAIVSAALLGLHPSVDGIRDSRWRRFANKLKTLYSFLIFPEFLVWQAIRERSGAKELMYTFESSLNWTKAHAYFLQMGGFVLHEIDFKFQFGRTPTPVKILSYQELSELVQTGETKWPSISKKDLGKLSTKRPFLSGFALFQTTSVLARTLIRAAHELPISHFELVASFYIIAGWTLSALWWDKPHSYSVNGVVPVHRKVPGSASSNPAPYSFPIQTQKASKSESTDPQELPQPSLPTYHSAPQQRKQIVEVEDPRFRVRNSHVEKGIMLMLDSIWWTFSDAAGMMDPECSSTIHETEANYPALEYEEVDAHEFASELALRPNRLYAYQNDTEMNVSASTNPVRKAGYSSLLPMVVLVSTYSIACNLAAWLPSAAAKSNYLFEFPGIEERLIWSGSASVAALSLFSCLASAYYMPEKGGYVAMGFSYPIMAFSLFMHTVSRSVILASSVSFAANVATTTLPPSVGSALA